MKTEHHAPYFKTINVLFGGDIFKLTNKSFIAEHMIINRDIMMEIIKKIENNKIIMGNNFFEKILYAIDKNEITGSGFSEFETYGNYVLKYYSEQYHLRELRTLREGSSIINKSDINDSILNWIAKSYDTISFEDHPIGNSQKILRQLFKFAIKIRIIPLHIYLKFVRLLERIINKK